MRSAFEQTEAKLKWELTAGAQQHMFHIKELFDGPMWLSG